MACAWVRCAIANVPHVWPGSIAQVRREKAIYHTLNKMNVDVTSKVLVAEAWVPTIAKSDVQRALRESAENSSTQVRNASGCGWKWGWVGWMAGQGVIRPRPGLWPGPPQ